MLKVSFPGLGSYVIQIFLFPCGKFLEKVLPDWGFTAFGSRHTLNPGPWTFKEQMFATITYNIAIYTTNAYGMILVQRSPVYYGLDFIHFGYQLMLTLFTQLMGMGFAGYLRRFSVYPVKALWPTLLPIIAMNRALTKQSRARTSTAGPSPGSGSSYTPPPACSFTTGYPVTSSPHCRSSTG